MSTREDRLVALALHAATAAVVADSGVPAGEYEIRAGVEGAVDGVHGHLGTHGRLTVGKRVRQLDDVLCVALALLLEQLGSKAAGIVATLAKQVKADERTTGENRRRAQTILRQLRKLTGVAWRPTPTYKPRT